MGSIRILIAVILTGLLLAACGDDEPDARVEASETDDDGAVTTAPSSSSAPCPGLTSESAWADTGTADEVAAAAGGSVEFTETVTNGPEPCSLPSNRCGASSRLLSRSGDVIPTDPAACTLEATTLELAPHEIVTETLTAVVAVPPGEYLLEVTRYDGTHERLPFRLDAVGPACRVDDIVLYGSPSPDPAPPAVREFGLLTSDASFQASFTTPDLECTARVEQIRLEIDQTVLEDDRERWVSTEQFRAGSVMATFGPIELAPGPYDATIHVHFADGDLSSPASVVVIDE